MFASINEEFRVDSKVPSLFKPRFRKFMTGSVRLRMGINSVVGIISVVIGGHFGGWGHPLTPIQTTQYDTEYRYAVV